MRGIEREHRAGRGRVVDGHYHHVPTTREIVAVCRGLRIDRVGVCGAVVTSYRDGTGTNVGGDAGYHGDVQRLTVLVGKTHRDALEVREALIGGNVLQSRELRR